jgi:hypothetical protein
VSSPCADPGAAVHPWGNYSLCSLHYMTTEAADLDDEAGEIGRVAELLNCLGGGGDAARERGGCAVTDRQIRVPPR